MNIEKEGKIFTPRYDNKGIIIATAEEVYQEWLNQQNSTPKPTLEERNRADIDYLSIMTGVDLYV